MISRRDAILGLGAGAAWGCLGFGAAAQTVRFNLGEEIDDIEARSRGRLGVAIHDTQSGMRFGHHAGDLFPMCSTFKLLACAAVLKRVEAGREKLDRRIKIEASDVVPGSSLINTPIPEGKTMAELCAAAMTYSDNTAANLILSSLGGPQAISTYARSIGDDITRLDRTEPTLNEAMPGDPRDTTTPAAMLQNIETLTLGKALSEASKGQLIQWLRENKTGDLRLRAGLPNTWKAGDKTGSGEHGSTNDVGIIWPPRRAPVLIAVYLTETSASPQQRDATLADVARSMVHAMKPAP